MPSQGGGGRTGPRESQNMVKAEIEDLKKILKVKRELYGDDRVKYEDKDVENMIKKTIPGKKLDVLRKCRDELQEVLREVYDMEQGQQQDTTNQAASTPIKHASQGGGGVVNNSSYTTPAVKKEQVVEAPSTAKRESQLMVKKQINELKSELQEQGIPFIDTNIGDEIQDMEQKLRLSRLRECRNYLNELKLGKVREEIRELKTRAKEEHNFSFPSDNGDENEKSERSELLSLRDKIQKKLSDLNAEKEKRKKDEENEEKEKKKKQDKEKKQKEKEEEEKKMKKMEKEAAQKRKQKEMEAKKAAEGKGTTSATEATPDKWEEIDDMNRELQTLSAYFDKKFDPEKGPKAYKERKESEYVRTKNYVEKQLMKAREKKRKADERERKENEVKQNKIKKARQRKEEREKAAEQERVRKEAEKQWKNKDDDDDDDDGTPDNNGGGGGGSDDGYTTMSDDEDDDDEDDDGGGDDSDDNDGDDEDEFRHGFIRSGEYIYHPPHTSRENLYAMKQLILGQGKIPRPYKRLSEFIDKHPTIPDRAALRICWDDWLSLFRNYARFVELTNFHEQHELVSPDENNLLEVFISRSNDPRLIVDSALLVFSSDSTWAIENYSSPNIQEDILRNENADNRPFTEDPGLSNTDPDQELLEEENITNVDIGNVSRNKKNYFAYVLERLSNSSHELIFDNENNYRRAQDHLRTMYSENLQLNTLPNTQGRVGTYSRSNRGLLYDILDKLTHLPGTHIVGEYQNFAATISEFIIGYHKKAYYSRVDMPWRSRSSPNSPGNPCIYDIFDNYIEKCRDKNDLNTHTRREKLNEMKVTWEDAKNRYHQEMDNMYGAQQEDTQQHQVQNPNIQYKIKRNWMLEIVKNLENYIDAHRQKINIAEVDIFDQQNLTSTSMYTIIRDAENSLEELERTQQYNEDDNMIGKHGTRQRLLDALSKLEECFIHRIQSLEQVVEPTYYYEDTYNYAIKLADWLHYVLCKFDIRIGTINFGVIAGKLKPNSIWKCTNDSFTEDFNEETGYCDGFGIFLSRLKRDFSLGDKERFKIEYLERDNANVGQSVSRIVEINGNMDAAQQNEGETNYDYRTRRNKNKMNKIMKKDSYYYLLNVESWLQMFYDGIELGMEYQFIENKVKTYLRNNQGIEQSKLFDICDQEMEYIDYRFLSRIQHRNYSQTTYRTVTRRRKIRETLQHYREMRESIRIRFGELFISEKWYSENMDDLEEEINDYETRINEDEVRGRPVQQMRAYLQNLEEKKGTIQEYRNSTGQTLFPQNRTFKKIFDESKQNIRLNSLVMGHDEGFIISDDYLVELFEDVRRFSEDESTLHKRNTIFQGVIAGYLDLQSAEIYKIVSSVQNRNVSPIKSVGRFFQKHLITPHSVYTMFQHPIWTNHNNGQIYASIKSKIMRSLWCFESIMDGMIDCIEYFVVKKQDEDFLTELHGLWQAFKEDSSISRSETNEDQLYTRLVQRMPRKLRRVKEIFFGEVNEDERTEHVYSGDFKDFKVIKLGIPIINPETQEMEYPLVNMDDSDRWYYSCKIVSKPPGAIVSSNQPIHVLREDFHAPQEDQQNGDVESVDTMDAFNSTHKVRLASWNVACANNLEKPTTEEQYQTKFTNIAKVIHESKCDIVALQELPNDVKIEGNIRTIHTIKRDLLRKLLEFTGAEWVMQHSTVFHSRSSLTYEDLQNGGARQMNGPKEVYAFLYNKNRIQYNHANQDETNRVDDRRRREERFSRLPIISNFTCNKLEFTLCTVHLPPYDKKVKTSQEIKDIFEKVFPELIKEYGNKKSKSAIFLGDFNMCYTIKKGFNPKPEVGTWDPFTNAGYVPCIKACTNVLQTQRFDNIWVHNSFEKLRIVSDDESGYTGVIKVNEIMGRPVITGSTLKEGFKKEVSDHNLVYVDFRIDELMPWSASNIVVN